MTGRLTGMRRFALHFLMLGLATALLPATGALAQSQIVVDYFDAVDGGDSAVAALAGDKLLAATPDETDLSDAAHYALLLEIGRERESRDDLRGAEAAYVRALAFGERAFGEADIRLREALIALGALKMKEGDTAAAEAALLHSLHIAEAELGSSNPSLREELDLLGQLDIPPSEDKSGPDGGDRAGSYRVREALLAQLAQLQRSEVVTLGAEVGPEVDQCTDEARNQNAVQRIEVFYGTHRKKSASSVPSKIYENPKGQLSEIPSLSYGAAYVSVPCNRDLGAVPTPSWWKGEFRPNPAKHVVLEDVREIAGADPFWGELKSAIGGARAKEALVFIHGFNVSFEGAALRTAQLSADLELDGAAIFYDWPSRAGIAPWDYRADRQLATTETIAKSLAGFLQDVAEKTGAERVSIIAHSMGNEPLTLALKELSNGAYRARREPAFDEVVFASPDVNIDNFKSRVADAMPLSRRMTLYASEKDKAVGFSGWFDGFERAGDAHNRVTVAGLDSVDTTKASQGFIGHDDFSGNGLDDLRAVVWHSLGPDKRCVLKLASGESLWAFNPQCENTVFKAAVVMLRRLGPEEALNEADAQIALAKSENLADQLAKWRAVKAELKRY